MCLAFALQVEKKNTITKMINTIIARKINTYRHPNDVTIKLPAVGASNGETPRIKISNEIKDALFSGGKKSRTIAIAATEANTST